MARKLIVEIVGDASSLDAALGRSIAATTGFGDKLQAVGSKMSSIGKTMTRDLTLPIVGIGALSAKAAIDFQSSMELIHTQAGVSQQAVDGLSKSVLAMAGSVATTPEQLSVGLFHLASQGLRGAQALDALKIAAEGAKVGQANLEDVTNALGAVLVSGIKGSKDYGQAMGQLNAIVGAGDMHMQDLADAMGTGLPAKAAVAGVSLRDVGAALAVFGDNNIRGAQAGTLLNSTLRLIEGPSKAAAKAMGEIGLNSLQFAQTLRSGGLVPAIEDLKSHLDGLSKAQQFADLTHMFGGKQAGGVMILIDQLERLRTKVKEVGDGGNQFASDWAAYTQTTAYKMDQMGASMQAAGISIGNILLPFVSEAVNKITSLANAFSSLPGPVKDMILAGAALLAVIGPMVTAIGALTTVLGFLIANPIVLVIAGVVALGAAIAAAVLWPDKLKSTLESMGLSASAAGKVVGELRNVFEYVKQGIMDFVAVGEALWREFGGFITTIAQNDWNAIKGIVSGALTVIRGVIDLVTGLIHGDWGQAWNGIKEIVSGSVGMVVSYVSNLLSNFEALFGEIAHVMWQAISGASDKVVGYMKQLPGLIMQALGDLGNLLVDAGKALMEGLLHGIENGAKGVLDKVKHVGSDVVNAAKGIFHINSPSLDFIEIGQGLMEGLSIGVDTGSKSAISSLKTALGKAKSAIDADQGLVEQAANLLGVKATQGIVDGALGVQQTAAQQLKTALETAMTNALALAKDAPEIEAATDHLGKSVVQKVVDGVVGKKQSMAEQIRAALTSAVQQAAQGVAAATSSFISAFDSLGSGILSQFDAQTSKFVAPAQKQLDAMQLQDQVKQYHDAIVQAAATVTADQQALAQAQAGGDPATIQAAQATLTADQAAYDAAVRAQQEFQIGQLAASQTKAYDAQRASQRESLAKQLADLRAELAKHPGEWSKMGKDVQAILDAFKVPLYESGQKFASQFASGIESQISAVEDAARKLADAVAKYIPRSPARTGPLAFSSLAMGQKFGQDFATGIASGLYGGAGLGSIAGAFTSAISTPTRTLGAANGLGASPGTATVNLNVNVEGAVGSAQQIAEELKFPMRDALLTIARQEPNIFRGLA